MHLFISHATKDSGREALALAEALEAQGHVCWIAPRDVRPGIPYPRQIVEALEQCAGLVLLLSPAANDSADVLQEVQLAAAAKKTIAPVVLAGTAPGADLRYYVSVRHQIAWGGTEGTARRLAQTFPPPPRGVEGQGEGAAPEPDPSSRGQPEPAVSVGGEGNLPRWFFEAAGVWIFIALIAVLVWQPWRVLTAAGDGALAGRAEADRADITPEQARAELERRRRTSTGEITPEQARAELERRRRTGTTDGATFRDCTECPEMVAIPGGSFVMGSPESEFGRDTNEGPQRRVTIARFAVGKYEVTRGQWAAFVAATNRADPQVTGSTNCNWRTPGFTQTDMHPVTCVNWQDARDYIAWLSSETGERYRLPSEAEWEYATRAGTTTPFSTGATLTPNQAQYAWEWRYQGSPSRASPGGTAAVGSFAANAFGLYDMTGNVSEWVQDCYVNSYSGLPTDGSAVEVSGCSRRVLRGGSWRLDPQFLRSAFRHKLEPTIRDYYGGDRGFRLARSF